MRIIDYIKCEGVTGVELAKMVGCSQPVLSQYTTGKRRPSPDIAVRIVKATGGKVTLEDLYCPPPDGE